jgi:hypothetical protein
MWPLSDFFTKNPIGTPTGEENRWKTEIDRTLNKRLSHERLCP